MSLHITVLHACTSAPSMRAVVLLCPEQNLCCAENGQSVIVKYLTSSKLTLLQLRDAAFRRTLLVQCLVLLHACAHPRQSAIKAATALKERQVSNFLPTHTANIQTTQFGAAQYHWNTVLNINTRAACTVMTCLPEDAATCIYAFVA